MAYDVVTIACTDEDPWGALLMAELARLEAEGWGLCAMTTRTVAVPPTGGMISATRYEEQLVLVLHRA